MSSEGIEHLSAVHDNPFIRNYGKDRVLHQDAREPTRQPASNRNIVSTSADEPEQEYHVNSGFVNKLRSKFAKLESNQNRITLSRKSASVENLLGYGNDHSNDVPKHRNRYGSAGRSVNDETNLDVSVELRRPKIKDGRFFSSRPSSDISPRPSSSEVVFKGIDKPPLPKKLDTNHMVRRGKPMIPARKTSSDSLVKRSSGSDIIASTRVEHHDWKVAPDLEKIGRDNIVIIESSAPVKKEKVESRKESAQTHDDDDFRQVKPMKDKSGDENELPKPNTVSAFRSLFESVNKTTEVVNTWRHMSPTRKSSSSEKGVISPVTSPRSPLAKKNDDNVFSDSFKARTERDVVSSPSSKTSDGSFSDVTPEIDTTPVSIKKSRERFQKKEGDLPEDNVTVVSPSAQHLTHPISKVFDSSSVIKSEAQKHKIPAKGESRQHTVPKDTLQMKHEGLLPRHSADLSPEIESATKDREIAVNDTVFNYESPQKVTEDSNRHHSGKKSGKTSPRKTKIFDSSNIVKKERRPPKVPSSQTEVKEQPKSSQEAPKQVELEIKDLTKKEIGREVSPAEPSTSEHLLPNSGITEHKTKIVVNRAKGDKSKDIEQRKPIATQSIESSFPKPFTFDTVEEPSERIQKKPETNENKEAPISGMSSFLASRLKKSPTEQENQAQKTNSVHLANGSAPSPVPRKRQAPERPLTNGDVEIVENKSSPPPLPKTPEPKLPSSNIDNIIKRKKNNKAQPSTKMVFDSSKIQTKRKEPPKRKPPRKTLEELNQDIKKDVAIVPKLDLSSITSDKPQESEYQEGYIPTVIQPCPYIFAGAEVVFEKSPYKKVKKTKGKISFNDQATKTYEYENEETALELYLREHPEEADEARKQEEEAGADGDSLEEALTESLRGPEPDTSKIKSNTVIGMSGGSLSNYKSKIQVPDFQFGMTPEPERTEYIQEPETESENLNILPADENELDMFSAEVGKADMLF